MRAAVSRAVSRAGSQQKLAILAGVKQSTVHEWVSGERPMPVRRCVRVERAIGEPCDALRPDLTWGRVPDPNWPHPAGRPFLDVARFMDAQGA